MSQLNPKQSEAMLYVSGPLLVLAGAGSGKTSVITRKIAYLIEECNMPAERITAVTFTNKAAREMKARVSKLLPSEKMRGLTVSTFHQFGLQFLRYELMHTPLKGNFSIMDSDDSKRLLMELMMRDNLSGAESRELVGKAIKMISDWKNDLIEPDKAMETLDDPEDMIFATLYGLYERNLRAYNAVDFDDLIVLPTKILRENRELRDKWQNRIRYLLVDEYQDTNTAQYEMIKYLVGPQGRFTVVGDDDQSIYAWRGAKPENMALLKEDFPKLKIVMLEQNYRSTTRILTSANAVILNNEHLFEKKLWSDKGQGEKIRIINCRNDDDEAERVAKEIVTHKLRFGNEWEQYAVLYRSNFQARMLEAQLRQLQVPYKLSGGQSFFARSEIKDIMGYLRLILNPEDDSAFLRIINTPKRGMGPATLEKLGLFAQEHSISLLASCTHAGLSHVLPSKAYGTIKEFGEFIEHYTRELDQHPDPVPIVRQMIDETGYIDFVRSDAKTPQQEKNRLDNIDMLYTSIQSLINRAEDDEDRTIDTIIRKLVLLDMLEQQQEEENTNKVNLMTLHAAKGLEFDFVYIMGLEEEMLPHRNSIISETIEEERRLMYVGITRARRELTLTLATQRRAGGQMRVTSESRFLDELPEDHIDWPAKAKKKKASKDPEKVADEYLANIRALLGNR
ncbi:MAG: UvrD-helicase domain-containing protein [Psychrobacter celer]|uniref:UvrD-helicase domain-containing protein n=1 Tax=Psychrobacter TaxID=497 RepID=UPI000946FECD|nr:MULTISPECIES: UvrD-helicase domain-containing protein [Psychrobacter]MDN5664940.1 UvrD-helicase domain-containing protein [Psychrobacter sp.]MDV2859260.1 UvrD-helicase domain-containing protein [Psychrobacter sp. CAM01]OLF40867.1 ATP-dependent DNA helicase Rep [Psychrobacter sp. Rd 27.2]PJX24717.1 ATP-dependent DNA helicase Rep [Psychrobacter sp. L7]HCH27489.1 ATP-dependent DNA helicase Rep [Psychrobacter sp.]